MKRISINTPYAPELVGHYSQAIHACDQIYVLGERPIDPESRTIPEKFEEQCHLVLRNLKTVLERAGSSTYFVFKITIYMSDLIRFQGINKIYEQYIGCSKSARTCIEVNVPKETTLEMDAIAMVHTQ